MFRILIAGILLFLFHAAPAEAVTLTVGTASGEVDETLIIPITVDNPEGVAGAAFTIVYPSALTVTVSSDFFDTFYSQFDPLPTTGEPDPDGGEYGSSVFPVLDASQNPTGEVITLPVVLESINYYQPLIANSVAIGMMISAARCTPCPAETNAILFTLNVSLKNGEPAGTYPIVVIPTTLNNTDAGYDAEGETIDLLIGSNPGLPLSDPGAFPVILDDVGYAANIVSGQAEFTKKSVFTDSDTDGIDDDWEMTYFGNLTTANSVSDFDHDGYSDKQEYLNDKAGLRDPSGKIYDPKIVNAPGGLGYFPRAIAPILLLLLSD